MRAPASSPHPPLIFRGFRRFARADFPRPRVCTSRPDLSAAPGDSLSLWVIDLRGPQCGLTVGDRAAQKARLNRSE